jgi:hypothetical protein
MSSSGTRQSPRLKLEADRLEAIARAKLEEKQSKILEAALASASGTASATSVARGGPPKAKKTGPRGSKTSAATASGNEEEEEVEVVQNVDLTVHKANLISKGYPQPIVDLLVSPTPAYFKSQWPDNSILTLDQWNAVRQIFINSGEWVRKDQNVYLNEIRERALLFIVALTDAEIESFGESNIVNFLKQLRDLWIGRMCDCRDTYILQHYTEEDENMKQYLDEYDVDDDVLIRKGGRGANWDFEFNEYVKLELKFSSTGKSGVDKLAQFVALNLEGTKALDIFGISYLDFFARIYLQRMVDMFNGIGAGLIIPEKTKWQKAAAATSPPANSSPDIKKFFETMRMINKDKNQKGFLDQKKTLVNESFSEFIDEQLPYLNGPGRVALQELLNNQIKKFFCIFTGDGDQVTCEVDQMPPFTIIGINHEPGSHTFLIITSDDDNYNVLVGLSWGNGGAGCNNPRAMFSLEKKVGKGGGFGDDDDADDDIKEEGLPEDDPLITEEIEIFDNINTIVVLENKPPIINPTKKLPGMELRNGKVLMNDWEKNEQGKWIRILKGGRKKIRKRVYSKKNKKIKFTKKSKINKKSKKSKKFKNKKSKKC